MHPGIILERELKQRKIAKGRFALSIHEFPQTLASITKGKRGMNTALALKIERSLGLEEGYFMILQVYFDIEKLKQKIAPPDLTKIRRVLFWDTVLEKLDWQKHKRVIIKRIFKHGNEEEKKEITKYYGEEIVNRVLN